MIHVVTGPPCAGKSTYVKDHAKGGDLIVDYDVIAQALGSRKSHSSSGIIRQAAFEAREGAVRAALQDPDSESWMIYTFLSEEKLAIFSEAGAKIIVLDPGYDECMERARRDKRPQRSIDGIEEWYHGQKGVKRMKKTKDFPVQYKDVGSGQIEGYASTWIRKPDSYGDVVKQGAFTKTLAERWNGGKGIPFLWAHQMDNLKSFIGTATADEDDKGLHFVATFDETEEAQKVRQLYKDGRLRKFSFAYDVKEAGQVTLEDGVKANELRELDLYEISAVTVPANDDAGVVDVKAGRRNSKSDEDKIKQAITLLQDVLGELVEDDPDDGEDDPDANAKAEERKASNPAKDALLKYIDTI